MADETMTTEPTTPTPPAPGDRPDVDALMERVRAGVADKLARGVYTQEEIDRVQALELQIREKSDFGPDSSDDVARLHETWDPLGHHAFSSHRGTVGKAIVAAKGLLRKALRPAAGVVLVRQAEFNGAVARLLTKATHGLDGLQRTFEDEHHDLLKRHFELGRSHQELALRCNEMLTEVRRLQARLESVERAGLPKEAAGPAPPSAVLPAEPPAAGAPSPLSYLAFEEKHRGPGAAVREAQRGYLRHFTGLPGKVLDAGCGRGEFLGLLREAGIPAYGIDLDPEMAARAREQGLEVVAGDLAAHLAALPDGSLGGIFAAQVVEHLTTPELVAFARLAHRKLAPGGRFLAETVNPACLATFSGAFYLDLTHVRPVHPEALRFLLEGCGFRSVELEFTSPFPEEMKLQQIDITRWTRDIDREFVHFVNDNFGRLNGLIYGAQDYAAVATR